MLVVTFLILTNIILVNSIVLNYHTMATSANGMGIPRVLVLGHSFVTTFLGSYLYSLCLRCCPNVVGL